MFKQEIVVQNKTGLHARPAAQFVELASKFKSEISVVNDGDKVNAKSIIGIMSGGIGEGAEISIEAEGSDEQEAVMALIQLVESKFGEA